ncbi:MAG: 16S rRNA (cytidine(1402)-2'-O)-methyltransferase [Candidatus Mycalebacterium zealandia]|nr:MAG: 16S rRNA (cytidine(1402)-2'-O)-methyltransferase [Candidatus Mycalebacterium zealandia]
MASRLYIVATPVGNLEDTTLRALRILKEAAAVACEDTRVTRKLFSRYEIKNRLISCHEHNEEKQTETIIGILKDGGDVALVTDAGTPLVSDPGYRVAARVAEEGFDVVPIPGASALLCALCASAIPFSGFVFLGFFPRQKGKAAKVLSEFVLSPHPVVIYESPKRTAKTLALLRETLGDRAAAVCREMTKLHEEVSRASLSSLAEDFKKRENVKGEIVIVVAGAEEGASDEPDEKELEKRLLELKKQGATFTDALKTMSSESGMGKNALYDFALKVWGN